MNRTPLYDWHKNHGAKLAAFAGWEMPILYQGIVAEHNAVRQKAGLFDIAHMGQFLVEGDGAQALLEKLCTNRISSLLPGRAAYSHWLLENGGVLDDIFVYCLEIQRYLVVVNAATQDKDWSWIQSHNTFNARLTHLSASGLGENGFGILAIQGPQSQAVVKKIFAAYPAARNECQEAEWLGRKVFLCRTGYTGEDGFEIVAPRALHVQLWEALLEAGRDVGIAPIGLGARDTLRLEYGFLLYGSDVDENRTSLESGPKWVVKWDKDFIGKPALLAQQKRGVLEVLTALRLSDRGIPRHGCAVGLGEKNLSVVTSGTFSPTLNRGIALAYLPVSEAGPFWIEINGKKVAAEKTTAPFLKKSTGAAL